MKVCINCNKQATSSNLARCEYCGGNLVDASEIPQINYDDINVEPIPRATLKIKHSGRKNGVIATLVVIIILLLCISCFMLGQLTGKDNPESSQNNSSVAQDESKVLPKNSDAPEERQGLDENFDLEAEVLNIRAMYNSVEAGTFTVSKDAATGVKVYTNNSGEVVKITVPKTENFAYSRNYYFADGKLYFAFVFDKTIENRFYFYNDVLFRWIDENKVTYDKAFSNSEYTEWEDVVLNDSYRQMRAY